MPVLVSIPDEFAALVTQDQSELPRQLVEDAALGAYCRDAITRAELQHFLGFATGNQLDGYLKLRGVEHGSYSGEDFGQDIAALDRLGFRGVDAVG